jgi:hypothetical protein
VIIPWRIHSRPRVEEVDQATATPSKIGAPSHAVAAAAALAKAWPRSRPAAGPAAECLQPDICKRLPGGGTDGGQARPSRRGRRRRRRSPRIQSIDCEKNFRSLSRLTVGLLSGRTSSRQEATKAATAAPSVPCPRNALCSIYLLFARAAGVGVPVKANRFPPRVATTPIRDGGMTVTGSRATARGVVPSARPVARLRPPSYRPRPEKEVDCRCLAVNFL